MRLNFWRNKKVLITGGASFIGSHLVDSLADKCAGVRISDDLSNGKEDNIKNHLKNKRIEFVRADLKEPGVARKALKDIDLVFHLAADHGGRGYVDLHQAGTAGNLLLDGLLFWEALKQGVEKIVFASSACVYPKHLLNDITKEKYLTEDMVKPPYDADNMYGWAKLMAELTLKAYNREYGLKSVSCRYFPVYGPRAGETHAVIAMIAKAFIGQSPFEVWGDGTQLRNWTYVDDIVNGTIMAAEKIDDAAAVNIGTTERIRVIDAAKTVMEYTAHKAPIKLRPEMPTGPLNRIADNTLSKKLLGWEPRVLFKEGLKRTIDWYFHAKKRDEVRKLVETSLTDR